MTARSPSKEAAPPREAATARARRGAREAAAAHADAPMADDETPAPRQRRGSLLRVARSPSGEMASLRLKTPAPAFCSDAAKTRPKRGPLVFFAEALGQKRRRAAS